jgi:hypothetical protein
VRKKNAQIDGRHGPDGAAAGPVRKRIGRAVAVTAALLAAAAVLGCAVFIAAGECSEDIYADDFTSSLADKYDMINTSEGGRLIFIGGSSLPFGLRSDIMSEALGMPVYDIGVYAALGTRMMCEIALACANKGDVLVLAPELTLQTYSTYFSASSAWPAVGSRRSIIGCLSLGERLRMAAAYFPYLASRLRGDGGGSAMSGSVYSRSAFNSYGDIGVDRPGNVMPRKFVPSQKVSLEGLGSDEFFDYVNSWAEDAAGKGCTVYFTFCPVNAPAASYTGAESDAFFGRVDAALDCAVLGSPAEMTYDSKWFYNTNFHLNSAGAVMHTSVLAEMLAEVMGIGLRCEIEIPEPRTASETAVIEGNGRDEALFDYEDIGGAWSVRLREDCRAEAVDIIVPASHDGRPVTGIGPSAFAGCPELVSVSVPDSVRLFEPGAFEDCPRLVSIFLGITRPDETAAPQTGLFDGAGSGLRVYVPDSAYNLFANDYSWRAYRSYLVRMSEA